MAIRVEEGHTVATTLPVATSTAALLSSATAAPNPSTTAAPAAAFFAAPNHSSFGFRHPLPSAQPQTFSPTRARFAPAWDDGAACPVSRTGQQHATEVAARDEAVQKGQAAGGRESMVLGHRTCRSAVCYANWDDAAACPISHPSHCPISTSNSSTCLETSGSPPHKPCNTLSSSASSYPSSTSSSQSSSPSSSSSSSPPSSCIPNMVTALASQVSVVISPASPDHTAACPVSMSRTVPRTPSTLIPPRNMSSPFPTPSSSLSTSSTTSHCPPTATSSSATLSTQAKLSTMRSKSTAECPHERPGSAVQDDGGDASRKVPIQADPPIPPQHEYMCSMLTPPQDAPRPSAGPYTTADQRKPTSQPHQRHPPQTGPRGCHECETDNENCDDEEMWRERRKSMEAECVNWTEVEDLCASMDQAGVRIDSIDLLLPSPSAPLSSSSTHHTESLKASPGPAASQSKMVLMGLKFQNMTLTHCPADQKTSQLFHQVYAG